MQKPLEDSVLARAQLIKLVIFDVDGVLTDGSLFMGDNGEEYKAFNSKDGHGLRMLHESGMIVAIITGRTSNVVAHRMEELGIDHVYQGKREKLPAFEELIKKLSLSAEECAYIGDDVVDLPIMSRVGLSIAVQDAHDMVKKHAHWITEHNGGRGAGRDVCEMLMDANGVLEEKLNSYLS